MTWLARRAASVASITAVLLCAGMSTGCAGDDDGPRGEPADLHAGRHKTQANGGNHGGGADGEGATGGGTDGGGAGDDDGGAGGDDGGAGGDDGGTTTAQHSGVQIGASFNDGEYDFGEVAVGSSVTLFMEVRRSLQDVEITEVRVTGQWFSLVDAAGCEGVLLTPADSSCVVEVAYRPGAAGSHAGSFSVSGLSGDPPASPSPRTQQSSSATPSAPTSPPGSGAVGPGAPANGPIAPDDPSRSPTGAGIKLLGVGT